VTSRPLDPALAARLELLVSTGVIGPSSAAGSVLVVDWAEELLRFPIEESNASAFVTHVAMALERSTRGEELEPVEVPEQDLLELAGPLELAGELVARLGTEGWQRPDYERTMLALHLAVLRAAAGVARAREAGDRRVP
jgi:hypothetical protein